MNSLDNNKNSIINSTVKINEAKAKNGITDAKTAEKVSFAFFLDHYKGEIGIKDPSFLTLAKCEWYAGSLSRHYLSQSIREFLQNDLSHSLDPLTKLALTRFVESEGEEVGYEIDLMRQSDPRLVILAKTGIPLFLTLPSKGIDKETAAALSDKAIEELSNLKPGKSALFLAGNLFHETHISVHQCETGEWIIKYYDSAQKRPDQVITVRTLQERILDKSLWQKVFLAKCSEDKNNLKIKMNSVLIKFGDFVPSPNSSRSTAPQEKNTCHTSGLKSVLKDLILDTFTNSSLAIQQWNSFKAAFGQFLLQKKELDNPTLKKFCVLKQQDRMKHQNSVEKLHDQIQKGNYQAVEQSYQKVLEKLDGLVLGKTSSENEIEHLITLHKRLLDHLEEYPISPERYSPYFENVPECVTDTFHQFCERYKQRKLSTIKELNEILGSTLISRYVDNKLSSPFISKLKKIFMDVQEALGLSFGQEFDIDNIYKKPLSHVALTADELDHYLELIQKDPAILEGMNKKYVKGILEQAIQEGRIKEVVELLDKADKSEIDRFLEKLRINPRFLPESVLQYAIDHPEQRMSKAIIKKTNRSLIKKGNIILLLRIDDLFPYTLSPSSISVMTLSSDQNLKDLVHQFKTYCDSKPKLINNQLLTNVVDLLCQRCVEEWDFESLQILIKLELPVTISLFTQKNSYSLKEIQLLRDFLDRNEKSQSPLIDPLQQLYLNVLLSHGKVEDLITCEKEKGWVLTNKMILNSKNYSFLQFKNISSITDPIKLFEATSSMIIWDEILRYLAKENKEKEFLEIFKRHSSIFTPTNCSIETFNYLARILIQSPDLIQGYSEAMRNLINKLFNRRQPEDIELINTLLEKLQPEQALRMIKSKQHYSKFVIPYAAAHPDSILARALVLPSLLEMITKLQSCYYFGSSLEDWSERINDFIAWWKIRENQQNKVPFEDRQDSSSLTLDKAMQKIKELLELRIRASTDLDILFRMV